MIPKKRTPKKLATPSRITADTGWVRVPTEERPHRAVLTVNLTAADVDAGNTVRVNTPNGTVSVSVYMSGNLEVCAHVMLLADHEVKYEQTSSPSVGFAWFPSSPSVGFAWFPSLPRPRR